MNRLTVLNPRVFQDIPALKGTTRLARLKDATIGFVNNSKLNADIFIERLQPMLREEYGIKIGATVRKAAPKDELTERDVAELSRCEAVVQCYGDCGTSTSMSVADGVKLEQRGIPTVTVCSSAFSSAARLQAAGRGMADLPIVEIPHPMHTAPRPMVEQRADAVAEDIADALAQGGTRRQCTARNGAGEIELADDPAGLAGVFFRTRVDRRPAGRAPDRGEGRGDAGCGRPPARRADRPHPAAHACRHARKDRDQRRAGGLPARIFSGGAGGARGGPGR